MKKFWEKKAKVEEVVDEIDDFVEEDEQEEKEVKNKKSGIAKVGMIIGGVVLGAGALGTVAYKMLTGKSDDDGYSDVSDPLDVDYDEVDDSPTDDESEEE